MELTAFVLDSAHLCVVGVLAEVHRARHVIVDPTDHVRVGYEAQSQLDIV